MNKVFYSILQSSSTYLSIFRLQWPRKSLKTTETTTKKMVRTHLLRQLITKSRRMGMTSWWYQRSKRSCWVAWKCLIWRWRSEGLIWLRHGISLQKTLSFWWTWKWFVIPCLFLDTGAKREDIFSIKEVFTKHHLNFLISLNRQVLQKLEIKQMIRIKHSNKRWGKECSPKWVKLILIIKFCMMLSLRIKRNLSLLLMEIFTLKAKSMKLGWEGTSLAEYLLN